MKLVTKGLYCHRCGRKENVNVIETMLGVFCKNCGAYVTLGKAFGLSGGDALILALILWGLFG